MAKSNGTPTLEQRVASALTDDNLTASQLAALFDELEQAIPLAEQAAEQAKAAACDPLQTLDLQAAQNEIETTALSAARLKALLPRLQQRCGEVYRNEQAAQWIARYDALQPEHSALAAELTEAYERLAGLPALLARIEELDGRARAVMAAKPDHMGGDGRNLRSVELTARGCEGFGMYGLSILKDLVLPTFPQIASRPAWPPPRNLSSELGLMIGRMSASVGDPRLTTGDWYKVGEEQARQEAEAVAKAEAERQAEAEARIDDRGWWKQQPEQL